MKKTIAKKAILLVALMVGACLTLFAENYETMINKGKEYEERKEYIYALGYYYDAMNSENAQPEAKDNYNRVSNQIRWGAKGLELSMWEDPNEAWNKIIREYYKYFTEYSPYDFNYSGDLCQGEINYKNKTINYTMDCNSFLSEKFIAISEALAKSVDYVYKEYDKTGYNWYSLKDNSRIDSTDFYTYDTNTNIFSDISWVLGTGWQREKYVKWLPYTSFSSISLDENKYDNEISNISDEYKKELRRAGINEYSSSFDDLATALAISQKYDAKIEKVNNSFSAQLQNELLNYYKKEGIALTSSINQVFRETRSHACLASFVSFEEYSDFKFGEKQGTRSTQYLPYELEFAIYDSDNNFVAKGIRQPISLSKDGSKSKYVFSNITESQMDIIKEGNYIIKPINAYLLYGTFISSGYKEEASDYEKRQSYIKNAAEIKMDIEKINIINLKEKAQKEREEFEKLTYANNYARLEKEINNVIETSNILGLSFDDNYYVTEVIPKSPAQKAGIKVGNTIKFLLNERERISAQEIIDTLDLGTILKNRELSDSNMEDYIIQFLNYEIWIVDKKIIPLHPGDSITCVINNGKKDKTIILTVPQKKTK